MSAAATPKVRATNRRMARGARSLFRRNDMSDTHNSLRILRPGSSFRGKQGHLYQPAISASAVGSQALHMQLLTIAPGEIGKAHKHQSHETAIYILSGVSGVWYGDRLQHHETAQAGEFVYIPANLPHMPYNPSATEPCVAVIARTDPNEQESVVLLPDLEAALRRLRPVEFGRKGGGDPEGVNQPAESR
jgi:uncharacterized RmlC-like cupin family protein